MLARRIVAQHVTKTTALAMLGTTIVLVILQVLFTYLGELSNLKKVTTRGRHFCTCCGAHRVICIKFYRFPR